MWKVPDDIKVKSDEETNTAFKEEVTEFDKELVAMMLKLIQFGIQNPWYETENFVKWLHVMECGHKLNHWVTNKVIRSYELLIDNESLNNGMVMENNEYDKLVKQDAANRIFLTPNSPEELLESAFTTFTPVSYPDVPPQIQ
jgi:hypothetical protein